MSSGEDSQKFRFTITGFEVVTDGASGDRFAVFNAEIAVGDLVPHRISKRYSEHRRIHDELAGALPWSLPPFPSRKFDLFTSFHTIDPPTLRTRVDQLNAYYSSLFSNPSWITCEKLHTLFDLPQEHRVAIIQSLL